MEKEFKTLKEGRDELRWQVEKRKECVAMNLLIDKVEKQDEEFIRLSKIILLEELPFLTEDEEDYERIVKRIDKLAGNLK